MSLDDLRVQIDNIDAEIVEMLARRVEVVHEIRSLKSRTDRPVYDPAREARLLNRVAELAGGRIPTASVRSIFREIISVCRAMQVVHVAYLGPAYTHSYLAAIGHFGNVADLYPCRTVDAVFSCVERGECTLGIVPIENSLNGVVGETCDCLIQTPLKICAESLLPVHHSLLAKCALEEIQAVYSHPQVLAQCRVWLSDHLPGVEQIAASSSAAAGREAAQRDRAAAVAPAVAADAYELTVLAENIEDRPDNRTRFFVVGPYDAAPTGRDKTSVVFSLAHKAGSLHEALAPLHKHGINMTLIQSRPAKDRLWEYVFFVDFEGHRTDPQVSEAIAGLSDAGVHLKVLGSFPAVE